MRGVSSFLFVISGLRSIQVSKIFLWKLSIFILTVTSYLCNQNNFKQPFLLIDHIAITILSSAYINNDLWYVVIIPATLIEYSQTKNIEKSKDISYIVTISKGFVKMYQGTDVVLFSIYSTSVILAIITIQVRRIYCAGQHHPYNYPLTWIWHICMTVVLYTSSVTAV